MFVFVRTSSLWMHQQLLFKVKRSEYQYSNRVIAPLEPSERNLFARPVRQRLRLKKVLTRTNSLFLCTCLFQALAYYTTVLMRGCSFSSREGRSGGRPHAIPNSKIYQTWHVAYTTQYERHWNAIAPLARRFQVRCQSHHKTCSASDSQWECQHKSARKTHWIRSQYGLMCYADESSVKLETEYSR